MRGHRSLPAVTGWSWLAAGLAVASITSAWAQTPDGRIPTVSRLVVLFTQHEMQLAERLKAQNAAGVGALLTDDFELRASSRPGQPVPRADWISQSMKSRAAAETPTEMAVHDLGNDVVVSFLQSYRGTRTSVFMVDVWRRAGDEWKLAVRYAAPAGPDSTAIPGVPPATRQIPKRY